MKRIQWFHSAGQGTNLAGPIGAVIGGLLVGSLVVVGCSKEKSTPASSSNQVPMTQSASNMTIPVNSANNMTSPTVPTQAKPKKVARKRAAVVTYADQSYGVSFQYPRKYTLKSGEKSNDLGDSQVVAMDFAQPGGVTVAGVELPKGSYPGTDLKAAFFNVSVNKQLKAEECEQFALPEATGDEKSGFQPEKLSMAGMDLHEVEDITRQDVKWADAKYYHVYQNGACYEFALGLTTEGDGTDDGPGPVDREDVFRRLEKILATVKIKQDVTPEATSAPALAEAPTVTADPATTVAPAVAPEPEGGSTGVAPESSSVPVATSSQQVTSTESDVAK